MEDKDAIKDAEQEARKMLEGILNENQVSYKYFLYKEMKKILAKQGIDWEPENNGVSVD